MSLLAYHHRRRALAALGSSSRTNYAGVFTSPLFGYIDTSALPVIGDLDFRLEVRVNLQNYVYGNFISGNSPVTLEAFCLYQRNGELLVYPQAPSQGKSLFKPLNTADQAPIGTYVQAGYERIGPVIYGLFEGKRVWAENVGTFTMDALTTLNISYRGGGGGGANTEHYLDWLRLDLGTGPGGQMQRWLDYQFNEADGEPSLNAGLLGGQLIVNGPGYIPHILV
jgi:hypothetical protein